MEGKGSRRTNIFPFHPQTPEHLANLSDQVCTPQALETTHIPQSSPAQKGDSNEQNNQVSYMSHSNKSSGKKSPGRKSPIKGSRVGGLGGTGILNRVVKAGLTVHWHFSRDLEGVSHMNIWVESVPSTETEGFTTAKGLWSGDTRDCATSPKNKGKRSPCESGSELRNPELIHLASTPKSNYHRKGDLLPSYCSDSTSTVSKQPRLSSAQALFIQ